MYHNYHTPTSAVCRPHWLLLFLLICLPAIGAETARTIEYQLIPRFDGDGLIAVDVAMHFQGDADGSTELKIPNEWAGETNLQ